MNSGYLVLPGLSTRVFCVTQYSAAGHAVAHMIVLPLKDDEDIGTGRLSRIVHESFRHECIVRREELWERWVERCAEHFTIIKDLEGSWSVRCADVYGLIFSFEKASDAVAFRLSAD